MAIINVTPDSFHAPSRAFEPALISRRAEDAIAFGADIIDIGAYSTRPGADDVPVGEELNRLEKGLKAVREVSRDIPVSVDTFRADVARRAVEEFGADIVNDISGGTGDATMFQTVASLGVPYILMHPGGTDGNIHLRPDYRDVTADVLAWLSERLNELSLMGVADVIIDPGFGFGKNVDDNYRLLHDLPLFQTLGCPILVGVSRKTMISKPLAINSEHAGNGTTVINTLALEHGASIVRVHDVEAARQAITLINLTNKYS